MVNASYLEAAVKHKQAKKVSLGTELAPHAKHKQVVDSAQERDACA